MFDSFGNILLYYFLGFIFSAIASIVVAFGVGLIDHSLEEYIKWIKNNSKDIVNKAIVLVSFFGVVFVFAIVLPILLSTLGSLSEGLSEYRLDSIHNKGEDQIFYFYCCFIFTGFLIAWRWVYFDNDKD